MTEAIHQTRTFGERSAIRSFNPNNDRDIQELLAIYLDEENRKWLVDPLNTPDEAIKVINNPGDMSRLYAISGSKDHVGINETGHVQGKIYMYPIIEETIFYMTSAGILSPQKPDRLNIEVGYAASPNSKSGQIASGVRQAITDFESFACQPVDFFACTDQANTRSEHVLTASGFEYIGQAAYDSQYQDEYNFWKLNWDRYHLIQIAKAFPDLEKILQRK